MTMSEWDWEKAGEALRRLVDLAEEYDCAARIIVPYGKRRLSIAVEFVPVDDEEPAEENEDQFWGDTPAGREKEAA
jgi:hypothetical protein